MTQITIFTDGAAKGNPGPGGYGVVLMSGKHQKELSGGFACTTNNRMELLAVIIGLEALKVDKCEVVVYSDSRYVVDAIEKGWLKGWIQRRFKNVKNVDLWQRYLKVAANHSVRFVWIKGHDGIAGNERCDQLAVEASLLSGLPEDEGYNENNGGVECINYE